MEEETPKMGIERDAKGRFLKGKAPLGGRPKGVRDWKTDFNEAVKLVAKQTGKTESEIRMEFLARGIAEGRKGNFNFWKEIIERNYGKIKDESEISGNLDLGEIIIKIINGNKESGDTSH